MNSNKSPVVIEGAMKEEVEYLTDILQDRRDLSLAGCPAVEGHIGTVPVVLVRSFVGTVNGAVATALAIEKYHPALVISQGTAGAHVPELRPEDLVIGTDVCCINSFRTSKREEGRGMHPEEWQSFPLDVLEGSWRNADRLRCHPCAQRAAAELSEAYPRVFCGTVGSGDVWNMEADRIALMHGRFGTLCEEMEGWGVIQTCSRYGVPCAVIRVISNNELTGSSFRPETAELCQRFIVDMLDNIYKYISE